jgi:hypothetical protein
MPPAPVVSKPRTVCRHCNRRHEDWQGALRCGYQAQKVKVLWLDGEGSFAVENRCCGLTTVFLVATSAEAEQKLTDVDAACGSGCHGCAKRHRIIALAT